MGVTSLVYHIYFLYPYTKLYLNPHKLNNESIALDDFISYNMYDAMEMKFQEVLHMSKKIMVVDDSYMTVKDLQFHLRAQNDYEIVSHYTTGEDALENIETDKPDIVMMDVVMPGMDGLETTKKLLKKYPHARIIILTSMVYESTVIEAKEAGASGFLCKPLELAEVVACLDYLRTHPQTGFYLPSVLRS